VSSHGVRLTKVSVSLEDVRFPAKRLISGGGGTIHASTGHGHAVLNSADATAALHRAGVPATVSLDGDRASVSAAGITVGLDVKLEDDALVLAPAAVRIASARIRLPVFVKGLRFTSVRIEDSEVVVSFLLSDATFFVPAES
jgi:hypothetical protein